MRLMYLRNYSVPINVQTRIPMQGTAVTALCLQAAISMLTSANTSTSNIMLDMIGC